MEGGRGGVIGRLVPNHVVMVLSCPVGHVLILSLSLEELTVREIAYGQGRAKNRNVLVNTIPNACYEVNHAWLVMFEDSQFKNGELLNNIFHFSLLSTQRFFFVPWLWVAENLLLFVSKCKAVDLLVCFVCSSWADKFLPLMSNSVAQLMETGTVGETGRSAV